MSILAMKITFKKKYPIVFTINYEKVDFLKIFMLEFKSKLGGLVSELLKLLKCVVY